MKNSVLYWSILLMSLLYACTPDQMLEPIAGSNLLNSSSSLANNFQQDEFNGSYLGGERDKKALFQAYTQSFELHASRGAQINSREGAQFKIPPNAFVDASSGQHIDEWVELRLIELYQKSDMIRLNKPTNYQNSFLVSAGEFSLEVSYGDRPLKLAPGMEIQVRLPDRTNNRIYKGQMHVFAGGYERGQDGEMTDRFSWNSVLADTVQFKNTFPAAYMFRVSRLGWTNCDAFLADPRPKTAISFDLNTTVAPQNCMLFLVPKNTNSVARIYRDMKGNFTSMSAIPVGLESTVVALGRENGIDFLAMAEILVTENGSYQLQLLPSDPQEIKDALQTLN